MAVARKRTTTRRRKPASTTPVRRRRRTTARPVAHRRSSPRKKGMLSEMFNPAMAKAGAKSMLSGAVGGFSAVTIMKLVPNQTPPIQAAILGGAAFVSATMLKMPNVAAGISAIAVYRLMENAGMLADDMSLAAFADPIEQLPAVLNEDGSANMYLSQNVDTDMLLADFEYQPTYAPAFGGM